MFYIKTIVYKIQSNLVIFNIQIKYNRKDNKVFCKNFSTNIVYISRLIVRSSFNFNY